MMDAVLWALIHMLGAEGSAVIGGLSEDAPVEVLHECGPGAAAVLPAAMRLVAQPTMEPACLINLDGRFVLAVRCSTRFGVNAGLAIWRNANGRPWDLEDRLLAASAVNIVRMILEYEAVQREMAQQARTDPLTGLLNRRAFLDEVRRHLVRLDREAEAGTLMFVDLDAFKAVNDRFGQAVGDQVLVHVADMLRRLVRPSDLIARLGGDEFAVWLSGADHMTAAERADQLCKQAPPEIQEILPEPFVDLGVSIGIATRRTASPELIEDLMRRADMAINEVKRNGRRHWRVSLLDGD
jgi:diguanylate cyclase (GGDEF)-like protein